MDRQRQQHGTAETPAPLNDEALATYFKGVEDGGTVRLDFEEKKENPTPGEYPTVGPVPGGGVPLDEALRKQRELLEELFHQHMPHVEVPEYEPWYPPLTKWVQEP